MTVHAPELSGGNTSLLTKCVQYATLGLGWERQVLENPTFILSQVAEIAGVPRNTLREWLRRDLFEIERPKGWQRFHFLEVLLIGVFADVMGQIRDSEIAIRAARLAVGKYNAWADEGGEFFAVMHVFKAGDVIDSAISESRDDCLKFLSDLLEYGPAKSQSVRIDIDLREALFPVLQRVKKHVDENGETDE